MMHVGNRIKEVLEEQGYNACWLASQIPCERSNVYNIFKRESIGIDLLFRISEVLGHDFFKEISGGSPSVARCRCRGLTAGRCGITKDGILPPSGGDAIVLNVPYLSVCVTLIMLDFHLF